MHGCANALKALLELTRPTSGDEILFLGDLIDNGMPEAEARRQARLKFGGIDQVREATRDEMRGAWLRDFGRDLRIAFRGLARVPSFSVTAILTIGLGIGAAAAMFTVVDGVLLRPLPYPQSDRIVQLFQISAVTEGTDAQAEVSVRLEDTAEAGGRAVTAKAADPDTLVASAKAYLSALNKLAAKRGRLHAQMGG